MTTLNLKYFKPSAEGYTEKSMSINPELSAERNIANDDALASILASRTMSLNEKYDSIRVNIAELNAPGIDNNNRFTI